MLDELTRHAIAAWLAELAETCEPCIVGTRLRGMRQFCRWDLPDLVGFLMATGLRIGKACGLTWNAVDLQGGTVEVRAAAVQVRGQGLVVKTTKTDAGTRTLVLPRWCTAMLRERAARLNPDRGHGSHPVFPAPWAAGATPPTPRPTCARPSPPPASTGSPPTPSAKPWPP